jgi:hypothetical protein
MVTFFYRLLPEKPVTSFISIHPSKANTEFLRVTSPERKFLTIRCTQTPALHNQAGLSRVIRQQGFLPVSHTI